MPAIYVLPLIKGEFEWGMGLIGLPFLLGTVVLLSVILFHVFGRTSITLAKGMVRVRTGVFGKGSAKELACGKGTTVTLENSSYRVNNVSQPEIVVASEGRSIRFGAMMLSKEAKPYVAAVLRRAAAGG